jgi:hypothetical protein
MASDLFYGEIRWTKLKVKPFFIENGMGDTLRMSSFKILSMRCIKFAQKILGAIISAF